MKTLEPPGRGQPITADFLNRVVQSLIRLIVPGPGITIDRIGNQVRVINQLWPVGRPGGGGASFAPEEIPTETVLTAPDSEPSNGTLHYAARQDHIHVAFVTWWPYEGD